MWELVVFGATVLLIGGCRTDVKSVERALTNFLEPPFRNGQQQLNQWYGVPAAVVTTTPPALPEIIINRAAAQDPQYQGYNYDKPANVYLPPEEPPLPFYDEFVPAPPGNQYLPPQFADEPNPGYLPPTLADPVNEYLPPRKDGGSGVQISVNSKAATGSGYNYDPPLADEGYVYNPPPKVPDTGYLPPDAKTRIPKSSRQLKLDLVSLSCLGSEAGYFRSTIALQSPIETPPIIDFDGQDDRCLVRLSRGRIQVSINAADFQRCGVWRCGADLCTRIRFPQIRGMKTADDGILTLQCKQQERIVEKVHSLRMGLSVGAQARNFGAVAHGGGQHKFQSNLGLFRRAESGAFSRALEPGGMVNLGEDMMLRVQVRSGDGWNFTRLSDVSLQRTTNTGELLNSAILVTSNGCLNPSMRSICSAPPTYEPPLGYRLAFRAVMFQGMRSGDEMLMKVRIAGCIHRQDCATDVSSCDRVARLRRSTSINQTEELFEEAKFSFRVAIPEPEAVNSTPITLIGVIMVVCLSCVIGIVLVYWKFNKKY